jgi:hypothetical protein
MAEMQTGPRWARTTGGRKTLGTGPSATQRIREDIASASVCSDQIETCQCIPCGQRRADRSHRPVEESQGAPLAACATEQTSRKAGRTLSLARWVGGGRGGEMKLRGVALHRLYSLLGTTR